VWHACIGAVEEVMKARLNRFGQPYQTIIPVHDLSLPWRLYISGAECLKWVLTLGGVFSRLRTIDQETIQLLRGEIKASLAIG